MNIIEGIRKDIKSLFHVQDKKVFLKKNIPYLAFFYFRNEKDILKNEKENCLKNIHNKNISLSKLVFNQECNYEDVIIFEHN